MAITVAEIVAKIRAEGANQVVGEMRKGEQATTGFTKKIGGLGRSLTGTAALSAASFVGITGPVLGFFGKTIDSASDLNESTSAVKTVFGDAAGTILNFSKTSATSLGLSKNATLGAAGALGAMYKGLGFTNKEMANFSKETIGASSDLASFYNKDPSEVLNNIRSGLVGEFEPLRQYGIMLSAASVEQRALAMTGKATAAELTEGEKVMARQALIMEGLGAAAGDFGRTQGGLANQTRIFKAQLADLSASLGQVLLPIALKVTGGLVKFMSILNALSPTAQKIVVVIGLVAAAIGPLLIVVSSLIGAFGTVTALFAAADVAAGTAAGPLAVLLGPIGLIIAALVGLGIAYKTNFLGFADAVDYVAGKVVSGLRPVIDFVGRLVDGFRDARKMGLDPFSAAITGVARALSGIGGENTPPWIAKISRALYAAQRPVRLFVEALRKLGGGDTARVHKILNQLPTPLQKLVLLFARVQQGVQRFTDAWKKAGALAAFRTIPQSIEMFGRTLANLITSITGFERFGDRLKSVFAAIGNVIGDVVDLVDDLIHGRWSQVLDDLGTLGKDAIDLFIKQFLLLPTLLVDIFDAINWPAVGQTLLAGLKIAGNALLAGISALGKLTVDAFKAIDWGKVGGFLVDGLKLAVKALLGAAGQIGKQLIALFRAINWGAVAASLGNLGRWLLAKGAELVFGLLSGARNFWDNQIRPWLADIGGRALGHVPALGQYLWDKGWDLLEGAWKGIQAIWDRLVKPFFQKIGGKVLGFIPGLGQYLWDKGWDILEGFWKGLTAIWDAAVKPFFQTIGSKILSAVPVLGAVLVGKGKALFRGLSEGVRQVWEPFSAFLGGLADTISGLVNLDTLKGILEPIADFFEKTAGRILGAIKDIGGAIGSVIGGGDGDKKKDPGKDQPATQTPTTPGDGTSTLPNVQVVQPTVDLSLFVKAFQDASDEVRRVFERLRIDIVNKLKQSARNLQKEAEGARSKVVNEFIGLNADLRTLMSKQDKILTTIWNDTTPTVKRQVDRLRSDVKATFINLQIDVNRIMVDMSRGIENTLVGLRSNATTIAFGLRSRVVNEFVGMRNEAKTLSERLSAEVLDELRDTRDSGGRIAEQLRSRVRDEFEGLQGEVKTHASEIRSAVSDQFFIMKNNVATHVSTLRSNTSLSLQRLVGEARSAAFDMRNAVVNQVIGMRDDAGSVANGIAGRIAGAIRDAVSAGYSEAVAFVYVGQNIGVGLRDGVLQMGGLLADAVRSIIRSALAAGNAEAKTKSPSEETIWTGEMMGEGYIVGALRKVQGIRSASQKAVAAALAPWADARVESPIALGRSPYNGSYVEPVTRTSTAASPATAAPTFIVMTRSELAAFFDAVDVVQVLTSPAEVTAALGGV